MKKIYGFYLYILIINILFIPIKSLSYEPCDTVRSCLGNALTLAVTQGKGAHYVDVEKTKSMSRLKDSMTIEFWMKPEKQAGTTQFVAGLWGPGEDKNDVWVLYFSPDDYLVFELNGDKTNLKKADNTTVRIPASQLYNRWNHIAAVFDGKRAMAYLYLNGIKTDSATNNLYPLTKLRVQQEDKLPLQIGSCNGLSDNANNRTFKGQIDEFRIWARLFSDLDIYCNRLKSFEGNEQGLILYYRFNEVPNNYTLCDATPNGNLGRARSGASCQKSDRPFYQTIFTNVKSITDTLKCDTTKSWIITVTDTSMCGSRVWMRVIDDLATSYKITPANLVLTKDVPATFTVTLNTTYTGNINSRLQVINYNRCGITNTIPLKITRMTELSFSRVSIDFGKVLANCVNIPYVDSVIRICNNTIVLGSPRDITISQIRTNRPNVFGVIAPPTPIILKPGECINVTVRFFPGSVTADYTDVLRITSNDRCQGSNVISLKATAQEAIGIKNRDNKRIDTLDFGSVCVGYVSDAIEYLWENLTEEKITVQNIILPTHFIGKKFVFPVTLDPKTGYNPNYFRFLPQSRGNFLDSIIFVVNAGNCLVNRKVIVKGRGYVADLSFTVDSVDFGDVIVGKERTMTINLTNKSEDPLDLYLYLRKGKVFFLVSSRTLRIEPGKTATVRVSARPLIDSVYLDELCFFETRCNTSGCVKLRVRGVYERFRFEPPLMQVLNVVGCSFRDDSLKIINTSPSDQILSKFQLDDPSGRFSLVSPGVLPDNLNLRPSESITFIFRYTPGDVLQDYADRAYLRYETSDKEQWAGVLFGSSISPKISVTELKIFGTLEVGDKKRDTVLIENISPFPVKIDSIITSEGYELIYPVSKINKWLNQRDTIMAIVDFKPTEAKDYNGSLQVFSSLPCEVKSSGQLKGKGIIVPLEAPISVISYGFVRPCDCRTREIPLINQSLVFPMKIDSVWIDSTGISNGTPEFFSWNSFYSPNGTTPYSIPPKSFDTLRIIYCPRTPSLPQFVDNAARINLKASGSGWNGNYETFLVGKRALLMMPEPEYAIFPPTRVDTFSVPQYVNILIPDYDVNPDRSSLRIDSITFMPNERVFYYSDTLGNPAPFIIDTNNFLQLKLNFKPRAVRNYSAKMKIYFSQPCPMTDTTVFLYGSGFAPAFGLALNFDNHRNETDTFRVITCDTLIIPIYSSREIPADVIDVNLRLGYDTTKLKYIGSFSTYLLDTCKPHIPKISKVNSQFYGTEVLMKNFCKVDSIKPILYAKFVPLTNKRDTFALKIDSAMFDTEELILYNLITEFDDAVIVILEPEYKILNTIDFDSVQVLDCKYDTLYILNTGDVSITLESILNLPKDVKIVSSEPPLNQTFERGDTAKVFISFCPRRKQDFDEKVMAFTSFPCDFIDSTVIKGIGYAPYFSFISDFSANFIIPDTITATLGDTINIPVYFEKDFSAFIGGKWYWLEKFSFEIDLHYNKYALKYLGSQSHINGEFSNFAQQGKITYRFKNVDSLKAGLIASSDFLVVVPDTIITSLFVQSRDFNTDSIMFIDIHPQPSDGSFKTIGECNLTYFNYSSHIPNLFQNTPNPWTDYTRIDFVLQEKTSVRLKLYDSKGKYIKELINSNNMEPGQYSYLLNSEDLNSGLYFYILESGSFTSVKSMILIK